MRNTGVTHCGVTKTNTIEEMERLNKLRANTAGPSAEKEEEAESTEAKGPPPRPEELRSLRGRRPVPAPRKKVLQPPEGAQFRAPFQLREEKIFLLLFQLRAPFQLRERKFHLRPLRAMRKRTKAKKRGRGRNGLYRIKGDENLGNYWKRNMTDYWCPPTVGKSDITIMLLFHVVTGEYAKVHSYQNIEEFFQQRGYSSYLTEKLFEEQKAGRRCFFSSLPREEKRKLVAAYFVQNGTHMPDC